MVYTTLLTTINNVALVGGKAHNLSVMINNNSMPSFSIFLKIIPFINNYCYYYSSCAKRVCDYQ